MDDGGAAFPVSHISIRRRHADAVGHHRQRFRSHGSGRIIASPAAAPAQQTWVWLGTRGASTEPLQ